MYNKIHKDVLEIKNFLSKVECNEVVSILQSFPEEFWRSDQYANWDKRNLKEDIKDKNLDVIKFKILNKVKSLFESYAMIVPTNGQVNMQRILPNTGGLSGHKDNFVDTTVKYGLVLYYNDDYVGGEIKYPEFDITYKPESGSLIIHDGGSFHVVNEVFEKTRYMSTFFIHEIGNDLAILKEKINE